MEAVIYETQEAIAIIRINRHEASNAINSEVMEQLELALDRAEKDDTVRTLILTGSGEKTFIAGGDLKEFHSSLKTEEDVYLKWSLMRVILLRIAEFPKPIIAVINGAARGGGAEVAAACHFRIASELASVGFVQVKLGISPGWGGGVLLQRIVGRTQALRMLLSGTILDARQAQAIGFFDEVVSSESLLQVSMDLATEIASHDLHAVQGILKLMNDAERLPLHEAMELESRLCARLWDSETHKRSIHAFLNRSKDTK